MVNFFGIGYHVTVAAYCLCGLPITKAKIFHIPPLNSTEIFTNFETGNSIKVTVTEYMLLFIIH